MMNFTIVAPCFNESQSIPDLVGELSKLLKNRTNVKLLIIDNGSSDKTKELLKKINLI
jgi:glycosyltransferase involved in cell wall biosynthesis